jgi:hypothetical protein
MTERRSNQRVRLFTPVTASTEQGSVRLLDLSSTGARMEHLFPLRVGSEITLRLDYEQTHLEVEASVVRSRIQQKARRTTYTSAVHFATEDHTVLDAVSSLIRAIVQDDFPARVSYA